VVFGGTDSNDGDVSGNHEDAWVVKLNSTGSILWQKCLGEYDCAYWAFSIEQTSDNGYVVAGFRASNEAEEVSGISSNWITLVASIGKCVLMKVVLLISCIQLDKRAITATLWLVLP